MAINPSTKPNDVLETTQGTLLKLLDNLTDSGRTTTKDPKEIASIVTVARALNDAAVTTRKLDIEDKALDEASQIARDMIEISKSAPGMIRGREIKDIEGEVVDAAPKFDRDRIPRVTLLPGQLGSEIREIELTSFMKEGQDDELA